MDDALALSDNARVSENACVVLILVVMDDALAHNKILFR